MSIIITGCSGGYDIFSGMPLYYEYQAYKVILVNMSYTNIMTAKSYGEKITDKLFRFEYKSDKKIDQMLVNTYFPEMRLSKQIKQPVYGLVNRPTVREIVDAYNQIIGFLKIDYIFLVCSGCSVLFTGKEYGELGEPVEDMMHLRAITYLNFPHKYILSIGLNVDIGKGVWQSDIDARLDMLKFKDVLLKCERLTWTMQKAKYYIETVTSCNDYPSIAQNLIVAAIKGYRGYYLPDVLKTICSQSVLLTDQTATMYIFNLMNVAEDVVYLNWIAPDMTYMDVKYMIDCFRANLCRLNREAQDISNMFSFF